MEQSIQDVGETIMPLEKESLCMLVEISMKVNGLKIEHKVKEHTRVMMEGFIKGNGRWTNNVGMELRHGVMDHNMKGLIGMV